MSTYALGVVELRGYNNSEIGIFALSEVYSLKDKTLLLG